MDLISQLTSTLGVDSNKAEGAAGGILSTIQQHAPPGALDALLKAAPEAAGWMQKAQAPAPEPSGLGGALGGLAGMLGGGGGGGGMLGSLGGLVQGAATAHALTGMVEKLGLPPEIAAKAVPVVLAFVRSKLGDGGFAKLAEQVPFLKDLA